jgi:hypothetical protein
VRIVVGGAGVATAIILEWHGPWPNINEAADRGPDLEFGIYLGFGKNRENALRLILPRRIQYVGSSRFHEGGVTERLRDHVRKDTKLNQVCGPDAQFWICEVLNDVIKDETAGGRPRYPDLLACEYALTYVLCARLNERNLAAQNDLVSITNLFRKAQTGAPGYVPDGIIIRSQGEFTLIWDRKKRRGIEVRRACRR